jgi:ParB-like chromosome segregation protein Spo0J
VRHVRHRLSALFGDMPEPALLALSEDIAEHGLLEPVVLYRGEVLDGWHRCKAAQMAGVEIQYIEYEGDDPGSYVLSKNLHRRQTPLTASQRAQLTVECKTWRPAGVSRSAPGAELPPTDAELAEEANTSVRTIQQAKRAHEAGLGEAVINGEMSAKKAAEQARGEPEKPKPPTALEKAEALIAELKAEIADLKETNQDLIDNYESLEAAKGDEESQQIKFAQLRAEIRALKSQSAAHMGKAAALQREVNYLRKKLNKVAA